MPKKAIIYDLDNTVYPATSIGDKLFEPVFRLIEASGRHSEQMPEIKKAMMRTPFRIVAKQFGFSDELTAKAVALQEEMVFEGEIRAFEDYAEVKNIPGERFLVTTGFEKMQRSKIRQLGIEADFKEVHVVNPVVTSKKEVFAGIMQRHNYKPEELLVIGDDPESEIQAAKDLGINTVLYDKDYLQDPAAAKYCISHFRDLKDIFTRG